MAVPPLSISSFSLELTFRPDIIAYEVQVTEKRVQSLEMAKGLCKNYLQNDNSGFVECSKRYFNAIFKEKTNCTIPGIFSFRLYLAGSKVNKQIE